MTNPILQVDRHVFGRLFLFTVEKLLKKKLVLIRCHHWKTRTNSRKKVNVCFKKQVNPKGNLVSKKLYVL